MPGPADQSYGIHVAQLAGLPNKVLREASKMLKRLEAQGANGLEPASLQLDLFSDSSETEETTSDEAISDTEKQVIEDINNLYLADKTPLEVMQLVASWQQDLKDED